MSRAAWAVVALAFAGCLPELVQIQGEHVLYEHSAEYQVCGGTVAFFDEIIPWLSEHLHVPMPGQIRYSWLTRSEFERLMGVVGRRLGESGRFACAVGDHAVSAEDPVHVHELAHSLWGEEWTAAFFLEGFAVACEVLIGGYTVPYDRGLYDEDDVWSMMTMSSDELDYSVAGTFVLFLLARHGPEKFARLYRALARPYTLGEIAAEFREVYGSEIGDEIKHFAAGDLACEDYGYELQALRCFGPEIPWTSGVWSFAGFMDCSGHDVVGGITAQRSSASFRIVTLEVPEDGNYEVSLYGDPGALVVMQPCFGCPSDGGEVRVVVNGAERHRLVAGRYQVRVAASSDEAPQFGVSVRPVATP